ncbi:MAG: sensor domain-containing diguanylate cyclase [Spirochaetales bacterium]|nr:sensor domain-containing diguanylate cyclase [Spirochaetales bacterium]
MNETARIEKLQNENWHLYEVLEVMTLISARLDLRQVLDTLMEKARDVMNAEASSLMLVDEETQELYFHTLKGGEESEKLRDLRLKVGEGISGWVAQEGKPVLVEDASQDPRFSRKGDAKSSFVTRSMMCVPLKISRRVLGTVQVLNKKDQQPFNSTDLRIFSALANQAAIAIENARLHELATVDGMTGLYLKNYFLARLEEEFRRTRQGGGQLSLIMSDIDHFKKVNTEHGHLGGDAALIELAHVIKDTVYELGGDDMAGRYGGEEFCVLMPDTGPDRALEVAEKIRTNIESHPIPIDGKFANITISIGIASYPRHKDHLSTAEDFIRLADEALYICKDAGRNCAKFYESR